jgi:hypothetical protein
MSKKETIRYLECKVKKLDKEIETQTREDVTPPRWSFGYDYGSEATLNGKINAIAEFLGIDFAVQPERVVASKVKATKKGKK